MNESKQLVKFKIQGLYATPEDANGVNDWISLHIPEERINLFVAAGLQWNWMAKVVNTSVDNYKLAASDTVNRILQREHVDQAIIEELLIDLDLVDEEIVDADNQS